MNCSSPQTKYHTELSNTSGCHRLYLCIMINAVKSAMYVFVHRFSQKDWWGLRFEIVLGLYSFVQNVVTDRLISPDAVSQLGAFRNSRFSACDFLCLLPIITSIPLLCSFIPSSFIFRKNGWKMYDDVIFWSRQQNQTHAPLASQSPQCSSICDTFMGWWQDRKVTFEKIILCSLS